MAESATPIHDILISLFTHLADLPGESWYSDDGDRAMYTPDLRVAFEDDGNGLKIAPNGEDGRGAHGDGCRSTFRTVVSILNVLVGLRRHLSTPALHIALSMLAERERQRASTDKGGEAWSEAHDDSHDDGALAWAAAYYAMAATGDRSFVTTGRPPTISVPNIGKGFRDLNYPWAVEWFKPKGRKRNAEIAAALLMAHSEVVDRSERKKRAAALPSAPFKVLLKEVFSAAGYELPTGGAYDAAILALKLHSVKQ